MFCRGGAFCAFFGDVSGDTGPDQVLKDVKTWELEFLHPFHFLATDSEAELTQGRPPL